MWGTSEGTANHMKSKPRNATKLFLLTAKDAIITFSTEPMPDALWPMATVYSPALTI